MPEHSPCQQTGIDGGGVILRLAETVTFGGGGLSRSAHLRADPARMAEALADGRVLVLWRGKVLMAAGAPGWLPPDHPVLQGEPEPVFLGEHLGTFVFATDISAWEPPADSAPLPTGIFDNSVQQHPLLPADWGFADLRQVMAGLTPVEAELVATARALLTWHRSHRFCANCGAASAMVMAGWQRSCTACGTQHFPRTDPVVIMLVTFGNQTLIGRSPGWPEGMYSCLAGFIEPGETVEAAVRREVFEESGVRLGPVEYLASQPWPFPASLMIGCRAQALDTAITLDPAELEDALWISREDLLSVFAGENPAIRPPRKGSIAQFLLSNWLADRLD